MNKLMEEFEERRKVLETVVSKQESDEAFDWLRNTILTLQCERDEAVARLEVLKSVLKEIAKGEGRFSRDPLEHASNTIEDMKALARAELEANVNEQIDSTDTNWLEELRLQIEQLKEILTKAECKRAEALAHVKVLKRALVIEHGSEYDTYPTALDKARAEIEAEQKGALT